MPYDNPKGTGLILSELAKVERFQRIFLTTRKNRQRLLARLEKEVIGQPLMSDHLLMLCVKQLVMDVWLRSEKCCQRER